MQSTMSSAISLSLRDDTSNTFLFLFTRLADDHEIRMKNEKKRETLIDSFVICP